MVRRWSKRPSTLMTVALVSALLCNGEMPASGSEAESSISHVSLSGVSTDLNFISSRSKNGWAYDMVRADEAQTMGYTGSGLRVAILDNGIDPRATGIQSKVVASYNAINAVNGQQEHGTATAGIVAAETNLEAGIGGVAPDVEILNVRVCVLSNCREEGVTAGLRWAIDNGADVISMSFGGPTPSAATHYLLKEAIDKGIVVVASAGNSACLGGVRQTQDGPKNRNCTQESLAKGFPGFYPLPGLITVGAHDAEGKRMEYSTYNAQVDVIAPGASVATTYPWGPFANFGGTSAAAPVVAGIAALIKQAAPNLSPAQIQAVLQSTALPANPNVPDVWDSCNWVSSSSTWECTNLSKAKWPERYFVGAGRVDAVAAIEAAKELEERVLSSKTFEPSVQSLDSQLALDWSESSLGSGPYEVLVDGDLRVTSSSKQVTLEGLINEASYSISIRDSAGNETPPVVRIPTARITTEAIEINSITATHDGATISGIIQPSTEGSLILSSGQASACRGYTCDLLVSEGSYTAQYFTIDSLGYLSPPSNFVNFSSTLIAAPRNLVFENITETSIDISWDAVPEALFYEYYDAGRGEWLETSTTSISVSGLNTALFSTFRVRAGNRETHMKSIFSPTFWYFALPPELPSPSEIVVNQITEEGVSFNFIEANGAERLLFIRSDGKHQFQPAGNSEAYDRFEVSDYGKTYKYWFISIDDMKYGTQYGVVSNPVEVHVPIPNNQDSIKIVGSLESLTWGDERTFEAVTVSQRKVNWLISGHCQKTQDQENQLSVRATSGFGECSITAVLDEGDGFSSAIQQITFNLRKKADLIQIEGPYQALLFKKSLVLVARTASTREVSWQIGTGCSKQVIGVNKVKITATRGTGNCSVSAYIPQSDSWEYASTTRQQSLRKTKEQIYMVKSTKLRNRVPVVISYRTITGRPVVFKSSVNCTVKTLPGGKILVKSQKRTGTCSITATIPVNPYTETATSKVLVSLG